MHDEDEEYETPEMWCSKEWHHYGHYWRDYDGNEWYCDGVN